MSRDSMFKCIYCGRYCSYDLRKTVMLQRIEGHFDFSQEQWFPENVIEFAHKKCINKKAKKEVERL